MTVLDTSHYMARLDYRIIFKPQTIKYEPVSTSIFTDNKFCIMQKR